MTTWDDVNARARGLASRLLGPDAWTRLREAGDLSRLSRELVEHGVLPEETGTLTAAALELGLRRAAARTLAIARRWLGSRAEVVAFALDLEDRRSLRALTRGAAAGLRADLRLAGLIPTPSLPERLLEELASRSRIPDQAALLLAAGHPYGAGILAASSTDEPDLFAVESAIARTFAARAVQGARRGGRWLADTVAEVIDQENCRAALALAGLSDEPPASAFSPGGRHPTAAEFEQAARAPTATEAARMLATKCPELAPLLLRHADDLAALERAFAERIGDRLAREARRDPLGPAPLLDYCHRLRMQVTRVSELIWGLALGIAPTHAPTDRVAAGAA